MNKYFSPPRGPDAGQPGIKLSISNRQTKVIEYVPKNRPVFNWKVILVLLLLWVAVVVAMVFVKAPMFRSIWPVIAVVLVGYLLFCTAAFLRRK